MAKIDPLKVLQALDGDDAPATADPKAPHDELREALDAATKADKPDLGLAKDLRAGVEKLKTESSARAEAEAAEREELRKLREGLFDDDPDEDPAADPADTTPPAADPAAADPAATQQVEEPVAACAEIGRAHV